MDPRINTLSLIQKNSVKFSSPVQSILGECAAIISTLPDKNHRLAANLQLFSGGTTAEVSTLDLASNFDGSTDIYGLIRLINEESYQSRSVFIPIDLYIQAHAAAENQNPFTVPVDEYTAALREAFAPHVTNWTNDALRWTYAHNRFYTLQSISEMSFRESLRTVAEELGYSNPKPISHFFLR